MSLSSKDQVALVKGAGPGIGLAAAKATTPNGEPLEQQQLRRCNRSFAIAPKATGFAPMS
jgi:NADP-dependent 3-hydroxy acid dehydrogenase YdfG